MGLSRYEKALTSVRINRIPVCVLIRHGDCDMFAVMSVKVRTIEAYEGNAERRDERLVYKLNGTYLRPTVEPSFIAEGGSSFRRATRKKFITENG